MILKGQIPESLGQLNYLKELSLDYNSLDGQVPSSIGNLSSLSTLYLYGNLLNGSLPESMRLLSNLEALGYRKKPFGRNFIRSTFYQTLKLEVLRDVLDVSNIQCELKLDSSFSTSIYEGFLARWALSFQHGCKHKDLFRVCTSQTQELWTLLLVLENSLQ